MYHNRTSNITHQIYHLQSSKKQTPILWSSNFSRCWFQTFFIFTPNLGEMIQFDEHIFQMGWFNHQPVLHMFFFSKFFALTTSVIIPRRLQPLALSSWRWGSLSDPQHDRDPFGATPGDSDGWKAAFSGEPFVTLPKLNIAPEKLPSQ